MENINIYTVEQVKEKTVNYSKEEMTVRCPESAAKIVNNIFNLKEKTREHFVLMCLNTKNVVTGLHVLHIGSVDASIVSPRDIYQAAILNNATSIIVAHNHPSGDPKPSGEDINVTKRINEAGKLMGIGLLDHIIIGDRYASLKEMGYF